MKVKYLTKGGRASVALPSPGDYERVTAVIAHTLPERNASNRVLAKAGFRFEGEAQEDDEVVWRFSLTRPASGA